MRKIIYLFLVGTSSLILGACSNSETCVCEEDCGCKEENPHESHQCTEVCDPWHVE